ncbi:phage late control D family protein [Grimontia kaedaensis]|uniref:Phage late control D family protein n=1 Tax=Grimontia kaedaensis TaxID=2872157 RepID=A0ABY4WT57_9GAMM|nr:contractile injection system protein, VgrG/Pvc8 family [Grimontia kaedaensis]USH01050.1 phage late control D family protein [Grimontia kaedaensis]
MSVQDQAGIASDSVTVTLDDRGENLALPPIGGTLSVSLGYQETGLIPLGRFVIDEVECQGPPSVMVVQGKAADMNQELKAPKTRTWQQQGNPSPKYLLKSLLETIAGEHGLTPVLGQDYDAVGYDVIHQSNESDLQLLTRLSRKLDAVTKPVNGHLVLVKRGQVKAASGLVLPSTTLSKRDVMTWQYRMTERERYQSVSARYSVKAEAKDKRVKAGDGKPSYAIRTLFPNEEEAKAAAQSQLAAFQRGERQVALTLPGMPTLAAEQGINLMGFREGLNGEWVAEKVMHRLSGDGFVTELSLVQKQDENGE